MVLFACPYNLAPRNESPRCDLFLTDEARGFEYELDLIMNAMSSFGLSGDTSYVNKFIKRNSISVAVTCAYPPYPGGSGS
ncbi:hypothetical protein BS17DRAFT_774134 [Gyrodon lividus]|nr:hypothetical protein BS17DRAFT_774134 [Gyrodon lividus]